LETASRWRPQSQTYAVAKGAASTRGSTALLPKGDVKMEAKSLQDRVIAVEHRIERLIECIRVMEEAISVEYALLESLWKVFELALQTTDKEIHFLLLAALKNRGLPEANVSNKDLILRLVKELEEGTHLH
jgi:hypothetical protein